MYFSKQLTLYEIIQELEIIRDKELPVKYDFGYFFPTELNLWKGMEGEMALNYTKSGSPLKVDTFLNYLRSKIGMEMNNETGLYLKVEADMPVWVANKEETGYTAILDIIDYEDKVIFVTGYCEH